MKKRTQARAKGGQILILMALLSTTFIIMFGMVVSIGHLVQAKMNLQNAVDLAAMSAASWQARYLNHIGLINYRMRQNYKFVLYDLYITQSRFNAGLRQQLGASSGNQFASIPKNQVTFGICQQSFGYCPRVNIPGVAVEGGGCTDITTDQCRNAVGSGSTGLTIPPIVPSPIINLNPALFAANQAIRQLGEQARQICRDSQGQNRAYFRYIMDNLDKRERFQIAQILRVLDQWKNDFSSDDEGGQLNGKARADASVLRTFRGNLINANNNSTAEIVYVNPATTRAPQLEIATDPVEFAKRLESMNGPSGIFKDYFERQAVNFKINVVNFEDSAGGCAVAIEQPFYPPEPGRKGVLLGLSRSRSNDSVNNLLPDGAPKIPFNIVVKGTVTPNLLFWPRGLTPTLVAIGAAKSFGSRIGPRIELTNLEVSGSPQGDQFSLANMSFFPGDLPNSGPDLPGMGHKIVLNHLIDQFPTAAFTDGINTRRPSVETSSGADCKGNATFLCLALAPTLYEGLFWTIFPYPNDLRRAAVFDPGGAESLVAAFPSDVQVDVVDPATYFLQDRQSQGIPGNIEEWHSTSLLDTREKKFRFNGKPVFFADEKSVLSAWSPSLDPNGDPGQTAGGGLGGRTGYQIKLTSLQQICREVKAGGVVPLGKLDAYCNAEPTVYH